MQIKVAGLGQVLFHGCCQTDSVKALIKTQSIDTKDHDDNDTAAPIITPITTTRNSVVV